MVPHSDSLSNRGTRELGNGLLRLNQSLQQYMYKAFHEPSQYTRNQYHHCFLFSFQLPPCPPNDMMSIACLSLSYSVDASKKKTKKVKGTIAVHRLIVVYRASLGPWKLFAGLIRLLICVVWSWCLMGCFAPAWAAKGRLHQLCHADEA